MLIPPNQPPTLPYAKTVAQRTAIRAWHRAFHEPHEEFLSLEKIVELERHERMQAHLENTKRELRKYVRKPRGKAPLLKVPSGKLMVDGLGKEFSSPFISNPLVDLENFHNDWNVNSSESDPSETSSYDGKTFNFLMDTAFSQPHPYPLINPNHHEDKQMKQARKSLAMIEKMKDVWGVTSEQREEMRNPHFMQTRERVEAFNEHLQPQEESDDATSMPIEQKKRNRSKNVRRASTSVEFGKGIRYSPNAGCFIEVEMDSSDDN